MTAGNDVDGVKLQAPEPTDYIHDAFHVSARTRSRQTLSHNGQQTGHGTRNDACLFHHHRLTSVSRVETGTCVFIGTSSFTASKSTTESGQNSSLLGSSCQKPALQKNKSSSCLCEER